MASASTRGFLGFLAAAISVVTLQQGMVEALHLVGLVTLTPYRVSPIPPFGIPAIVNLCFWDGLYGVVFGLLLPRFTLPVWLCGLITGMIAALVGMFVLAALKGVPIASGWQVWPITRSLLVHGTWGLGLGLILPLLLPRPLSRSAHGTVA
jgi:hypothetical protein